MESIVTSAVFGIVLNVGDNRRPVLCVVLSYCRIIQETSAVFVIVNNVESTGDQCCTWYCHLCKRVRIPVLFLVFS